jgi:hypothetical protein
MHPDDELTDRERRDFEALPRESRPSADLERRVVAALREEGLLHRPAPLRFPITPAWIGTAVAASLILFTGGFALGGWMESRHTNDMLVKMHEKDTQTAAAAAAAVQRTGSAYVAALTALAAFADTTHAPTPQVVEGREVAANALHAAASQMVRIAPEDPLAVRILQGLDRVARRDSAATREGSLTVWF